MTHEEAAASGLVEKYTLGELAGELREEFEEHFFICTDCAADVRAAFEMTEAIRYAKVSRPEETPKVVQMPRPGPTPRRSRWGVWAAVAAGVLLCMTGYQNLV